MAEQYDEFMGKAEDVGNNVKEITSEMEAMRASRREEDNQGKGPTPQNLRNKQYDERIKQQYAR